MRPVPLLIIAIQFSIIIIAAAEGCVSALNVRWTCSVFSSFCMFAYLGPCFWVCVNDTDIMERLSKSSSCTLSCCCNWVDNSIREHPVIILFKKKREKIKKAGNQWNAPAGGQEHQEILGGVGVALNSPSDPCVSNLAYGTLCALFGQLLLPCNEPRYSRAKSRGSSASAVRCTEEHRELQRKMVSKNQKGKKNPVHPFTLGFVAVITLYLNFKNKDSIRPSLESHRFFC